MAEKTVNPLMDRVIVLEPAVEMLLTGARTGHRHALIGACGPAAHHRIGHFGVELQAEGAFDINTVFAGILVLTAFALALDAAVSVAERRLLVWRPTQGETERL